MLYKYGILLGNIATLSEVAVEHAVSRFSVFVIPGASPRLAKIIIVLLISTSHSRTGHKHVKFENACGAITPDHLKDNEDCGRIT